MAPARSQRSALAKWAPCADHRRVEGAGANDLAGQLQSAPDDLEAARERADSTPTLFSASSGFTSGARGSIFVDEYRATGGTDSSR